MHFKTRKTAILARQSGEKPEDIRVWIAAHEAECSFRGIARDCADDVPGCTRRWLFWTLNEAYSPGSVQKLTSSSSLDKLLRIVDIPLGTERGERVPSPVLRAPN